MPVRLTPEEFDELAERAYARIPARFRRKMSNVALVVEPRADARQMARAGMRRDGVLLGLYEGRPLTARSVFESFAMPDRITIFQQPHQELARNPAHLEELIAETVWHEIAHHFGMDEGRVRRAEKRIRMTARRPRRY
jgi:predicted Zn-dependent protease with MMP-like domain